MSRVLEDPRLLTELGDDADGQLATEWVLLAALVVSMITFLVPTSIGMIRLYFYRIAEIVQVPFP